MVKFSIVVPVYNVEQYVGECIDSVLNQSYSSYELILVNDGSVDSSGLICDCYHLQKPEKISVIHNTNKGVHASRLYGVKCAIGEYVLFLDADDCLRVDALEQISRIIEKTSSDLVVFNASKSSDYQIPFRSYGFADEQVFQGDEKNDLYRLLVHTSQLNNVCLKAVRRVLIDVKNLGDIVAVKYGQDFLLSLQLITAAERVVHLNQNLYYYRQRGGSTVHSFTIERLSSVKTLHLEAEQYIELWGLPELKPGHYAREVRGWADNLVLVLEHRKEFDKRAFCDLLSSMSRDPYFLRAYGEMDGSFLSHRQRCYAKWLKEKQFHQLFLCFRVVKCMSKFRLALARLRG